MNALELECNLQAHERAVHGLNREPALPFADAGFKGAMCTVSVDYLVRPREVFDEVARCLGSAHRSCARSPTFAVWAHRSRLP